MRINLVLLPIIMTLFSISAPLAATEDHPDDECLFNDSLRTVQYPGWNDYMFEASDGPAASNKRFFFEAVESNDIDAVEKLIDAGVDPNIKDDNGKTALMHAAQEEDGALLLKALLGHPKTNPNEQDDMGWTALHIAVSFERINNITALLNHLAIDPKIKDWRGNTALHIAAQRAPFEDIVITLLEDGRIDANAKNKDGETALHIAVSYCSFSYDKPFIKAFLSCPRVDLTAQNNKGETASDIANTFSNKSVFNLIEQEKRHKHQ